MKIKSLLLAVVLAVGLGCVSAEDPPGMTTSDPICDPAIALMTTGSQSVIGTRTITKIINAQGVSVQANAASGCSSGSSICEVSAGTFTVGGSFHGANSGSIGIGPLTQVGLIVGPSNGQCSENQSFTADINKLEEMALITSLSTDPGSPYVIYMTAIWPAS